MLLILFLISYFIFNFSYLFSVMFLMMFVFFLMMVYMANLFYLKFLIMMVYISGVVVFILYISCMCWNISDSFSKFFLVFGLGVYYFFDYGMWTKFADLGEALWMYLFFGFLFNSLVSLYSLNLFKVAGSLRM